MDRPTRGPERAPEARAAADPAPSPAPIEPRQRWRIVFGRDEPTERTHRELAEAWIDALVASGLPLPRSEGRPRPPLTFAAPLPVGMRAERELADLVLAERLTLATVRAALAGTTPPELRILDLHDVWLGAPALAAALTAADYRVTVVDVDVNALRRAAAALLAAPSVERERPRGGGTVRYDLRPLLGGIGVDGGAGAEEATLRIRTRFDPQRGAGRPEEVLLALGERLDAPLKPRSIVRERLILDVET